MGQYANFDEQASNAVEIFTVDADFDEPAGRASCMRSTNRPPPGVHSFPWTASTPTTETIRRIFNIS
jgi:hypothetical protein